MVDKLTGFCRATLVLVFAKNRDNRLRESAFCKQAAQQVRQFEGDKERISEHSGAEDSGDNEIANEAEDAREQRHSADGGEGFKKIHYGFRAAHRAREPPS